MRIDLHSHSSRSDGTLSPAELIAHAVDERIDCLALTDHDTSDGWAEAIAAARSAGILLIPGMEISCRYAGHGVHLLAYLPDPTLPALDEELGRILGGREARLPLTLRRLNEAGIPITEADVRSVSDDASALGRPHIADALIRLGVVADRDEAFTRFLGPRGPAYVDRYAADLEEMIDLVAAAGGASVIAHPWAKRHDYTALGATALKQLRDRGLAGIEVDHQDHDVPTRAQLRRIAAELDLVVTGSSDFHGEGKFDHDLGCNLTAPAELERLLERAARAAKKADRSVPSVIGR
jgi:hypothetical protein